ncbi:response regulator transcription factor [Chloroflexota bacterium]
MVYINLTILTMPFPVQDRFVESGSTFDIFYPHFIILNISLPQPQTSSRLSAAFFEHRPDLILLDVVMPKMDGWQTCERIRDISDVPIIMLTGKRVDEEDLIKGLEHGADDYLIKPVGNRELVARVRATLRRAGLPSSPRIREGVIYDDNYLSVDISKRQVVINRKRVKLTPREFRLFTLLLENAGRILTHQKFLERVWGWEYSDDVDYVRIYISHLRHKIEPNSAKPRYIITESGVGYYFQKTP